MTTLKHLESHESSSPLRGAIVATLAFCLLSCGPEKEQAGWHVVDGKITNKGQPFDVRCANWNGLEGRGEQEDYQGSPMELYVGNLWWAPSDRTIQQTMSELKEHGLNMIRLPIAPQTLDAEHEDGLASEFQTMPGNHVLNNAPEIQQANARQALEDFILLADKNDIAVLINIHSCSNRVPWQAGGFDSIPQLIESNASCNEGEDEYNENVWLDNLKEIASLPKQLGVDNIIGIDIFNEPWSYSWEEWKALSEKAYSAIDSIDPDLLIWVEGVAATSITSGNTTQNPHGDPNTTPNWGENLFAMKEQALHIPKNKLVLSPHTFGPSVYVNRQFLRGECADLESKEAFEQECEIVIDEGTLEAGWEEHFGYLKELGYAVVIGEFGGNMNWPSEGTFSITKEQDSWDHIDPGPDLEWQNLLVSYMKKKNIGGCYASVNPELSREENIGGLYIHRLAEEGVDFWGSWGDFDWDKINLLKRLWGL